MPCVPGTKRPSCPDDLGPLNPGGVGFMERGAPTCHEAGEKGVPESRTQGRMDSGVRGGSYSLITFPPSCAPSAHPLGSPNTKPRPCTPGAPWSQ